MFSIVHELGLPRGKNERRTVWTEDGQRPAGSTVLTAVCPHNVALRQ